MASDTVTQFRCALYGRVSTKDKGQEVQNQLRQLREFVAHSGCTIVAEYIDHESGKGSDREQFQAMFDAASKRQFDVLLFWSLDRLSREGVLPTLQHLQRLTSYGVGFRSYTDHRLETCWVVQRIRRDPFHNSFCCCHKYRQRRIQTLRDTV